MRRQWQHPNPILVLHNVWWWKSETAKLSVESSCFPIDPLNSKSLMVVCDDLSIIETSLFDEPCKIFENVYFQDGFN